MTYVIIFATALTIVLVCGPMVKQMGHTWQLMDHPDPRKMHHQVMVRSGGIAIALGTTITAIIGALALAPKASFSNTSQFLEILLVALSFFGIGLADDRWSISPKLRLGFQLVVSNLVWSMGLQIHHLPIPGLSDVELGWLSLPITFLWIAGVTNAINWLDGLDGLASGISIIAALTFALLGWQQHNLAIVILAISLAGAGVGFLRYNAMPAQMYMGDSGSYFIGGILASLGICLTTSSAHIEQDLLPYFTLAVPVLDMTLVILSRLADRKSPFFPDQRHIHHRLLRLNLSKQQAVFSIYGLSIWASITAGLLTIYPAWAIASLLGLTMTIILFNQTALQSTTSSFKSTLNSESPT
jgi:UDP-GlcNAc:undecaprenyl-phosphate/decaprenyl-phosphate GlcNAc-1-phosphate transferase